VSGPVTTFAATASSDPISSIAAADPVGTPEPGTTYLIAGGFVLLIGHFASRRLRSKV
jgi:hypothetical protein